VFVLPYYVLTFNYANVLNCDVIFLIYMPRSAAYSPEGKQTFVGNVQQSVYNSSVANPVPFGAGEHSPRM
jgi:hypothetical protein